MQIPMISKLPGKHSSRQTIVLGENRQPIQRAPDEWDSARFKAFFWLRALPASKQSPSLPAGNITL